MMRDVGRRAAVAALVLGVGGALRGAPLAAQETAAPENAGPGAPDEHRLRVIGVWTAVGRDEPLATRLGRTHDRDLYIAGVRLARQLGGGGAVRVEYTLDVLPAIVMTGNPVYAVYPTPYRRPLLLARTQTVYGAGLVPLGLQLRAALGRRAALLALTSGGVAAFARPIPDPEETRFNFTADVGAAFELRLTRTLGASAGFRYHHLSNAGMGRMNPGMNTRMLELGVARLRD